MTFRRLALAGLAAVLAAGPAFALPGAPARAASKPGYVAIVISGHGSYCVKWKSGITGDTVLNTVATVQYRSDGLILQIDGDPTSGTADASHYWSYWHDTSGSRWAYSNYGASSYQPAAGTVEGWSYDNGAANAPAPTQDPSGLYASLCGARDAGGGGTVVVPPPSASSAPATSAPSTHRSRARSAHHTSAGRPAPSHSQDARTTSSAPSDPSTPSASSTSTRPAARSSSTRTSLAATTAAPSSSAPAPASASSSGAAPHTLDASPTASASSSSGSPVGLFVVLGIVVVLGAGAGAVALRRRGTAG
ncbi:hypothetical protein [Jatrophihabitans endophyticus]|uniref:hypothetical protein n=1 Tax=Jatrophihabitans endophyticus TaxID=1206085 RepID=UPI001A0C7717|nr:hypothetical protein [Jatrophihabitans endophyticus]MBE7186829.1 hypothetical protein [Jatrophihabitans endophyticus]